MDSVALNPSEPVSPAQGTGSPSTWLLARTASSASLARHQLRGCRDVPQEPLDDAGLLLTELVTNALTHSRAGDVRLVIDERPGRLRVSVSDEDPRLPVLSSAEDGDLLPGGRGMQIIAMLASDWGCQEHPHDGKTVWFELAW